MGRGAVVIIHGFGGGRYEVAYLRQYLQKRGIKAFTIRLAGHEGSKAHMAASGHQEWVCSAARQVIRIRRRYPQVLLVGFSMGGLVAANLIAGGIAAEGLVLVNTPIYFWDIKRICINIWKDLRRGRWDALRTYLHSSQQAPFVSLLAFLTLLHRTKPLFRRLHIPSFIVQCKDDDAVQNRSADYLKAQLGPNASLKYLHHGGHVVFCSGARDKASGLIYQWIRENFAEI